MDLCEGGFKLSVLLAARLSMAAHNALSGG